MISDSEALLEGYQSACDAKHEAEDQGDDERVQHLTEVCDRLCWLYVSAGHAEKGEQKPYALGAPA